MEISKSKLDHKMMQIKLRGRKLYRGLCEVCNISTTKANCRHVPGFENAKTSKALFFRAKYLTVTSH